MFERADELGHTFCVVHEREFTYNGDRQKSRSYASYETPAAFLRMYNALEPRDRHFYEIIRGPVRFYLDIEFKVPIRDDADATERLSALLSVCAEAFAHKGITVEENEWIVQDGSRAVGPMWKHSFHVNLKSVYFEDNATALKPFMTALRARMESDERLFCTSADGTRQPIVDFATNTRNRAWRLPLSSKAWDGTPLKLITPCAIEDALVTVAPSADATIVACMHASSEVPKRVASRPPRANQSLEQFTRVLRAWGDATSTLTHELSPNGTRIIVGRTVGSRTCPWGHTHDSNNFYLTVKHDSVWYHCHAHTCRGKSEAIGVLGVEGSDDAAADAGAADEGGASVVSSRDDFDLDTTGIHTIDIYNEQHVKRYTSPTKVLLIKSGMNTGKTTELCKTLRREARVIVITTRIAFARTMLAALPGFQLYQDVEDVRSVDRLIIEYESLRKLLDNGTFKPFDCVVLDEIESLLCNTTSPTNADYLQVNKAIFEGLVTAARVYAMDADLSNKTLQFFKDTVGAHNITLHHNQRQSLERKVVMDDKLDVWLGRIEASLAARKRIVVASGSKKIVDAYVLPLVKAAGLRWRYYHGECDDALLDDFARIDEAWSELDVVIFTSKVTVGADFSVRSHFDHIFAYGCAGSVPPRVLLQMCGRCRYPTDNVIYACAQKGKGARVTLEDVRERHRVHVGTMRDTARVLDVDLINEGGVMRIQPMPTWIAKVYAYNCLEEERSRADFQGELLRAALAKGYRVEREDGVVPKPNNEAEAALRERRIREFDETATIDTEQADEVQRRQAKNRATEEDKRQLDKFKYQSLFTCDVDGEHYVTLNKRIGVLAQICTSLRATPLATVLERDVARWQGSYAEISDVKFTRLDLVRKVAGLMGLGNELDTTTDVLSDRILEARDNLNALVPSLWSEFSLREKNERRDLKALLGLVNTVLTAWCGGKLVVKSKTQRRRGDTREWVYTYRLSFPTVHDGKTLVDIAKDTRFFS